MPTVDYGAVACWLRLLREREEAAIVTVNETTYSELLHVSQMTARILTEMSLLRSSTIDGGGSTHKYLLPFVKRTTPHRRHNLLLTVCS